MPEIAFASCDVTHDFFLDRIWYFIEELNVFVYGVYVETVLIIFGLLSCVWGDYCGKRMSLIIIYLLLLCMIKKKDTVSLVQLFTL